MKLKAESLEEELRKINDDKKRQSEEATLQQRITSVVTTAVPNALSAALATMGLRPPTAQPPAGPGAVGPTGVPALGANMSFYNGPLGGQPPGMTLQFGAQQQQPAGTVPPRALDAAWQLITGRSQALQQQQLQQQQLQQQQAGNGNYHMGEQDDPLLARLKHVDELSQRLSGVLTRAERRPRSISRGSRGSRHLRSRSRSPPRRRSRSRESYHPHGSRSSRSSHHAKARGRSATPRRGKSRSTKRSRSRSPPRRAPRSPADSRNLPRAPATAPNTAAAGSRGPAEADGAGLPAGHGRPERRRSRTPPKAPTKAPTLPITKKVAELPEDQLLQNVAHDCMVAMHCTDQEGEPPLTKKEEIPAWAAWLAGKSSMTQFNSTLKDLGYDRRISSKKVGAEKLYELIETIWRE